MMKNTLTKLSFYKSKAVMTIENSIGVTYGEANPFIQFKFAPREDAKSQGQWDDANCYWITSYADLYNFVSGMNLVASGKLEKYDMKNPKKQCNVQIRASKNEKDNTEYMMFGFYRGDVKIGISLVKTTEYAALFSYYKNLLDSWNTVCMLSLFRNDYYYVNLEKNKGTDNTKAAPKSQEGGSKFNQNAGTKRFDNSGKTPAQPSYSERDIDNSINDIQGDFDSGGGSSFDDDIPF